MLRRWILISLAFCLSTAYFLGSAISISAQDIPLSYQLMMAYQPSSYTDQAPTTDTLTPSPTPTTSPAPQVLGDTTSIPSTKQVVKIALLGDSMIDTLGSGAPSLASALAPYLPNYQLNILNYGYGASNIEYAQTRLISDYDYNNQHVPSLISQSPDVIVIESFAYNNFGNTPQGLSRQQTALTNIVNTIKQKLPNCKIIIAATIAPNATIFGNGITGLNLTSTEKIEKTATIKLYLNNAIKFATTKNIPLADAYHPSLINGDGNPDYISTKDHLHPSLIGANFFSTILAKTIYSLISSRS